MITKKYKIFNLGLLIFILLSQFSLFTFPVHASVWDDMNAQLTPVREAYGVVENPTPPPVIIMNIVIRVLSLLAIIFIILMIYAGYSWMTARGNEEQVEKAKKTMVRATIGLGIIMASLTITFFVLKLFMSSTNTDPIFYNF